MTNVLRQKWLDKKKWLKSEKEGKDLSGKMNYCEFCSVRKKNVSCSAEPTVLSICSKDQGRREKYCLCATAYNALYHCKNK